MSSRRASPMEIMQARDQARDQAREAAAAIRAALDDPARVGAPTVAHLLMARPRRGVWLKTWESLPGLTLNLGTHAYQHALLPGWQYSAGEMKTEMLDDLERFAATGEQPKAATR
jgi:hypothetical protein